MEMVPLRRRKTHGHASSTGNASEQVGRSTTHPPSSRDVSLALDSPDLASPQLSEHGREFKVYNVLNSDFFNISICPTDSDVPIYFITNSTFLAAFTRTPELTLRSGSDRMGPVLGVGRLTVCGANTIGVGDPDAGGSMVWEELRRATKWTHAVYHFEWDWGDGERRKYEWRRTKLKMFDDQDDLALVERGRDSVVLATYECVGFPRWKRRGVLRIKDVDGVGQRERDRWMTMVILTGMSLVELARRRSRARRSSGGG